MAFKVIENIKESGIFNYYIKDIEYLNKCTVIRLDENETLNNVAIKTLQQISDIYGVEINIRYSDMSDSIIIVVDV